ncbi:CPBP family intramembrane glutamic endopeptidase [Sulfitobacter sp. JB4-11]|uniref:CPBP family intramembrane glutamic endopeptidase n=1 Tax=Sulfitobacter rhodophyticola TaxID=3238304 RepID=UPI0035112098
MRYSAYQAHEGFVRPARAYPQVWRLLVGLVVAGIAFLTMRQLYFSSIFTLAGTRGEALYQQLIAGSTPLAMYLMLFSFGFMVLATGLAARMLHRRPLRSVLGPFDLLVEQFSRVFAVMVLLNLVVFVLPPWDMGGDLRANLSLGRWMLLLPFSILAVLVQVSAEEVFFRGYLQQQLAARFKSPLVWLVLPSAIFALGHFQPEIAGQNALIVALWAGIFGMLMADLTARAGSLGPAIAVHLANNVLAIVFIAVPDQLSGLSLYLAPFAMADTQAVRDWLPVDFALMFVAWLAARLAIRR